MIIQITHKAKSVHFKEIHWSPNHSQAEVLREFKVKISSLGLTGGRSMALSVVGGESASGTMSWRPDSPPKSVRGPATLSRATAGCLPSGPSQLSPTGPLPPGSGGVTLPGTPHSPRCTFSPPHVHVEVPRAPRNSDFPAGAPSRGSAQWGAFLPRPPAPRRLSGPTQKTSSCGEKSCVF